MSDMGEVNYHIDNALRELEQAVLIIESEKWTDAALYIDTWVIKIVRPALFALKQAVRLLNHATALIADDVKEAEEQAKLDKWRE